MSPRVLSNGASVSLDINGSLSGADIPIPVVQASRSPLFEADRSAITFEVHTTLRIGQGRRTADDAEVAKFERLVAKWRRETGHLSNIKKAILHPSYQSIIGMGQSAVPLLLRELATSPDHWFWALHSITEEDPAPDGADIEQASRAWVEWGKLRGLI